MKNIKDIVIGIFAVIGFAAIVTGFTKDVVNRIDQEIQQDPSVPDSHVWEGIIEANDGRMHLYNKKTGEVRKYALGWPKNRREWRKGVGSYFISYLPVDQVEE